MSATLAVIWWRDIPAQVVAREGRRTHKVVLDTRFQEAIDRAAVRAGLTATDAYLAEWRREQRACGDDLEAEASAESQLLDTAYPQARLAALIAAGGKASDA
ncbi:MAG: virulence factor [Gaiellales bacterium]